MLGRRTLPMGDGLWLPGVASVHTFGVRFPLDLLFLDCEFHHSALFALYPCRGDCWSRQREPVIHWNSAQEHWPGCCRERPSETNGFWNRYNVLRQTPD